MLGGVWLSDELLILQKVFCSMEFVIHDRWIGIDSRLEKQIVLYSTASRQALGPTQPPIQWAPGRHSHSGVRIRASSQSALHFRSVLLLYHHREHGSSAENAMTDKLHLISFDCIKKFAVCVVGWLRGLNQSQRTQITGSRSYISVIFNISFESLHLRPSPLQHF
jgi:hypothetical protein